MITGMPSGIPCEEKRKYYIYGFWHIHEGKPYVMKNGSAEVHEFDEIDDALKKLKELSLSNVNITWCLTWDKVDGLLDLP